MQNSSRLVPSHKLFAKNCALEVAEWFSRAPSNRPHCVWLEMMQYDGTEIRVYVRNAWNARKPTIANIEIMPRGQQLGRTFLMHLEYEMPNGFVIENVLNSRFDLFLQRRGGYRRTEISGVPSFTWTGEV